MFSLVTGVALFLTNALAGALWDMIGPQATFLAGAACAVVTIAVVLAVRTQFVR